MTASAKANAKVKAKAKTADTNQAHKQINKKVIMKH